MEWVTTSNEVQSLRVARRGSRLSVAQAEQALDLLRECWPALRIEPIEVATRGDRDRVTPLAALDRALRRAESLAGMLPGRRRRNRATDADGRRAADGASPA